ncbi:MAG: flavodoxin family protein [Deltaproteobacteria bacterium]|nr:flavodoxin family protein [Deltaproteobacteria bacterium]
MSGQLRTYNYSFFKLNIIIIHQGIWGGIKNDMNTLIVYSSVTGNTRLVAEGIAEALPAATKIYPVHKAPPPIGYDLIFLGFWVYRGKPDPRMLRYMQRIHNQKVALFGTLAAWPDSPHAQAALRHARHALGSTVILGEFLCLGKLSSKRFNECMNPAYAKASHPMTPERKTRLLEGQTHPDDTDIIRATEYFCRIAGQLKIKGKPDETYNNIY